MKVLRVITSMNPKAGGPCQGIRNSVPALRNCGIETEVVCFDDPSTEYKDSFTINSIGPAKKPYLYCKRLAPWLNKNMLRFDVVIIHGLWMYNSYGTYRVWEKLKRKISKVPRLYIMPHGMLDPYFQKAKERKLKAVRNLFFWHLIESKVVNGVDGVLFTCEQELLLARTTFSHYLPKREINIGYGVIEPPIKKMEMKGALISHIPEWNEKPFWLFMSRIHSKKGVDLLINSYLKLERVKGGLPQLIIAGPALDADYGREMEELASPSKNIIFPGMLTKNAKWAAFYEAEAFILPSHQENFGIAVVEALACGTPVLISDKINIYREVIDSGAGLLFSDTQDSCDQILDEWNNFKDIKKEQYGLRAFECYKKYYDIYEVAKKFKTKIHD
ncbi:glycosyltransferase [Zunongwangia profunda]|nr:glycosyltransferase [Zunongwangia profunda]